MGDPTKEELQENPATENTVSGESAQPAKKRRIDSKYWKIGFVAFVVVACLILFYFIFFNNQSLFNFLMTIWKLVQPFLYGAVLAYLLKPVVAIFEKWTGHWFKKMKNRHKAHVYATRISVAFTMILFVGFIYIIFAAIIPEVINSAKDLVTNLPHYTEMFFDWLEGLAPANSSFHERVTNWHNEMTALFNQTGESSLLASITDWITNYIEKNYNDLVNSVTSSIRSIIAVLMNALVATISCIYMLAARKRFGAQGKMIVYSIFPEKAADKVMDEVHYMDRTFTGFINGKILDSIIIGILCYIVMRILRIPYPLLVSVVVGVTNIIPFFGPFIGAIPSAFIILLVDPIKCLTFVIAILVIQQLDGNVIGPKILGNTTGVSSFWVLFSITLFGGLWGIGGMIIGVPLFAVLYDIIRQLVEAGLDKRGKGALFDRYKEKEAAYAGEKERKRAERAEKRKEWFATHLHRKNDDPDES